MIRQQTRSSGSSALVNIIAAPNDLTLLVSDNGNWYSNEGAIVRPILTLPLPVEGMSFTAVATFPTGLSFQRPVPGVFINRAGVYGVQLNANQAGATCRLVATSETTWMVIDCFPEVAWTLSLPSANDFSDDLLAWREEVRLVDGEPLTDTMRAYDQFIYSEQFYGLWDKTVDYALTWKQASEHESVALTSLKLRRRIVRHNGPESGDGLGYLTDGVAQWLDWPIVPIADAGGIMTSTNQRIAVYDTTESEPEGASAIGSNGGPGTPSASIRPRTQQSIRGVFSGGAAFFTLPEDTALGFSAISRTATTISAWRNGVPLGTSIVSMVSGLPAQSLYLGGTNLAGVLGNPLAGSIPFAAVGGALTDAEEAIAYRNMLRLAAYHGALVSTETDEDG